MEPIPVEQMATTALILHRAKSWLTPQCLIAFNMQLLCRREIEMSLRLLCIGEIEMRLPAL